jgi:hypothetical protein
MCNVNQNGEDQATNARAHYRQTETDDEDTHACDVA